MDLQLPINVVVEIASSMLDGKKPFLVVFVFARLFVFDLYLAFVFDY